MLAELFDRLQKAAEQSRRPTFHTHESLPGNVFFVDATGEVERFQAPPPARNAVLDSYESLTRYLEDKAIAPAPEVYVSFTAVHAFLDREERRSRLDVHLLTTERFTIIHKLMDTKGMSPKHAITWLRRNFEAEQIGEVVKALSRIDFKRTSSGAHRTDRGRETLGREVEAQVQQIDQIPEAFRLTVDVWQKPGFTMKTTAKIGIDLDVENEQVVFFVQSDDLEKARWAATQELAGSLAKTLGESIPVFTGHPTAL